MTAIDPTVTHASFTHVFGRALRGLPCVVAGPHETPQEIPTKLWTGDPDHVDEALMALCHGATLDIGCGPGRLSAALAENGQDCLGIDLVGEAVEQAIARGASAERRSVFDPVPGEGTWQTALLADGNIGIGGDPTVLLRRAREVVRPDGRIVVEVESGDLPLWVGWATLHCEGVSSRPFRWARMGASALTQIAAEVGLVVAERAVWGERQAIVLVAG